MANLAEGFKITIIGMSSVILTLYLLSLIIQILSRFTIDNEDKPETENQGRYLKEGSTLNTGERKEGSAASVKIVEEIKNNQRMIGSVDNDTLKREEKEIEEVYAAVIAAAVYQMFRQQEYKIISIKRKDHSAWKRI